MFEEENFIYNTQAMAVRQQQSFQSTYTIYQGSNLSLLSSLTLLFCHRKLSEL